MNAPLDLIFFGAMTVLAILLLIRGISHAAAEYSTDEFRYLAGRLMWFALLLIFAASANWGLRHGDEALTELTSRVQAALR